MSDRDRPTEAVDTPAGNVDQPRTVPVFEVELGPGVDEAIADALRRKTELLDDLRIPSAFLDVPGES